MAERSRQGHKVVQLLDRGAVIDQSGETHSSQLFHLHDGRMESWMVPLPVPAAPIVVRGAGRDARAKSLAAGNVDRLNCPSWWPALWNVVRWD